MKINLILILIISAFACEKNKWTQIESINSGPIDLGAHTLIAHSFSDDCDLDLFVFGGFKESFSPLNFTFNNNLWKFNLASGYWTKNNSTEVPPCRGFHAAASNEDYMFIGFGLVYDTNFAFLNIYNDLYAFNYHTETWTNLTTNLTKPSPRGDLQMVHLHGKLYIFGGVINEFFTLVNDLWSYEIITQTWTFLTNSGPSSRISYQMVAVKELNILFLSMGEGSASLGFPTLNDSWIYSIDTGNWSDITPPNEKNIFPAVDNYSGLTIVGTLVVSYAGEADDNPVFCSPFVFPNEPTNTTWFVELQDYLTDTIHWKKKNFNLITMPLKRNALTSSKGCECIYNFGGFNTQCINPFQIWNNNIHTTKIKN